MIFEEGFLVGKILGVHGLRGDLKGITYCENMDHFMAYAHFKVPDKDLLTVEKITPTKGLGFRMKCRGIDDRSQAQEWVGSPLWVDRAQAPKPEKGQYFYKDLEGMAVLFYETQGRQISVPECHVKSVVNYGGGDLLVMMMAGVKDPFMAPFKADMVKKVCLKARLIELYEEALALCPGYKPC